MPREKRWFDSTLTLDWSGSKERLLIGAAELEEGERSVAHELALVHLRASVLRGRLPLSKIRSFASRHGGGLLGSRDEPQAWREIEQALRTGRIRVIERERARSISSPGLPDEAPDEPHDPRPPPEIVDDPRSLFIVRCDAELGNEGPLRFTYLMRGLAGGPATLEIRSETFPGKIVHQRDLSPAETSDGSHDSSWDGRVLHPGEDRPRRLSAEHGPCTLEVKHDATYRDEAVFRIAEPDFIVEFADLHFATDRELLLPLADEPEQDPERPRAAPLHVVAALLEFGADHPERTIVVYGHADSAGAASHNDGLSEDRARTVQLYLAGEREAWAAHAQEHYEIADFKRVHLWAAQRFAWATDPGSLDNEWTSRARKARAEFRRRCDELLGTSLEQGVKQNTDDWEAIFDLYDVAVASYLECKPEDLGALRAALAFASPAIIGCGEQWPVVHEGQDGVAERLNRRAEIMFFQPGELPSQHGSEDPPGDELHASGRYRQVRLAPVGSDEALLRITLLDEQGDPISGADYQAETRAGPWVGVTDDDGVATVPRALVDAVLTLEWTAPGDESRLYRSRHHLATDGETTHGLLQRLANLGFERFGDPELAVIMFQHALGIPATGKLDDVAELVNEWHESGRQPEPDPADYEWPDEPETELDDDHHHLYDYGN